MTIETIQKLKEVGVFDGFKKAMEILVEETDKPQIEWDDGELNCDGLKYNPDFYRDTHINHVKGYYKNKNEEYLSDLTLCSLKPATNNTESFKSFYSNSYHDDCQISGLDFGCVKWNPYLNLKKYIKELTDISFSCFHGKTPQEILDMLNEK